VDIADYITSNGFLLIGAKFLTGAAVPVGV
jgi:hypothetical protein